MNAAQPAKIYYDTRSLCPHCNELVDGQVVARNGQVFVTRACPEHGRFDGLICSDQSWYEGLGQFDVEGVQPKKAAAVDKGCPEDCGLCSQHRQIAGTAAIEISNDCNADCPACLANNQGSFQLTAADVTRAVDNLLKNQDTIDLFTLSGGEPTVHPELFDMLAALRRPEINRIMVNSNGIRIAEDDAFLDRLAKQENVYVCLHYDGPNAHKLRGTGHDIQERALERLIEWKINVVPLMLAAQGVNDHQIGPVVTGLLTRSPAIKSVIVSMMTYAGKGGLRFEGDPLTRLTIPAALESIEQSAAGVIVKKDFIPLPMPNPLCAAIGYFLTVEDEITALIRHSEVTKVVDFIKNANVGRLDEDLENLIRDAIDRIYANADAHDDAEALLGKFRQLLKSLFPESGALDRDRRRQVAEESLKSVYLMQFMDAWSFDSERLCKCSCQHLQPDGSIIPSCGYYAYHRTFDSRFN